MLILPPIFLLASLFLPLGDIVPTALPKPELLSYVSSFILPWLRFWGELLHSR